MTWREGQAAQLDFFVAEIDKLLAELENGEAIAEELGDANLATETRAAAAVWRGKRADLAARARDLRNTVEPWLVLPIALTTRHVRSLE